MATSRSSPDAILLELRRFGLAYPGAHTKSPWPGHLDLAVKDKTFAYLSLEGEPLGISCKLPRTNAIALMLPFCKPAAYGLGKSGWVTAQFGVRDVPPIDMLKAWIDESYRSQAPKKLAAGLPPMSTSASTPTPAKQPPAKQPPAKRPPAKQPPAKKPAKQQPAKQQR